MIETHVLTTGDPDENRARPTAAELVSTLAALGVELWEDDGRLRFRARHGVLTDEHKAELSGRKAELIAHLRDRRPETLEPDPGTWHDPFPLTDIQAAYLMGRRTVFAYGGTGCHAYGEVVVENLDAARVEDIWNQLVERHAMLRAVIDPAGSQRVLPTTPRLVVTVDDRRGRTAAEQQAAVDAVRAELDHRVYEPSEWPLFDVRVTRTDQRDLLHLSIDFLIADFVSIQVLLDEFALLHAEPGHRLPELGLTFRDYLLAERRERDTPRHARDRRYWEEQIDSLPPAPELPVQEGGRDDAPVRFTRRSLSLSRSEFAALRQAGAEHGVTASAVVLGAYADVIGRWSRRRRFTLNLTMLRRLPVHPDVDRLVGDFTNAVLLPVDAGAGDDFAARTAAVQEQLWANLEHASMSGVEVVREIARRRGADAALMPVVFTSALGLGAAGDDQPAAAASGSAGIAGDHGISQTPQVWIDCQALERSDGLVVNWDVREGVFAAGMVDDMFAAFTQLLHGLAAGREWSQAQPVALPPAQAARRAEVVVTAPLSGDLLFDGLLARARSHPGGPALITSTGRVTHGELAGRASAVAAALQAAGVGPGDLVGVLAEPGPGQMVAAVGVLLAGAAFLPVDTAQPAARRRDLLADAAPALCLCGPGVAPQDPPVPLLALDADGRPAGGHDGAADGFEPVRVPDTDRAYVIYTSGSTGRPKGVVISHRGAVNTVEDITRRFGVGAGDRVLGLARLSFDLAIYDLFGVLAAGGAVVMPDAHRRTDPSHWAELAREHDVTLWNSVPAQLQMLADYLDIRPGLQPASLRLALLSGDWIPVGLPDQIRAVLPQLTLHSLGGATEASIWSIGRPIEAVPLDWVSIPYGRPLTNQTVEVLDELMRTCPDGTVGEIFIGGVGVADGYLGRPELTAERFVRRPGTGERLYRTGDLGRYLPNGEIEFLGREDLQVKIRGHRIELAEVEAALTSGPDVAAAAVVVEGEGLGRRLAAFVQPARVPAPEPPDLEAGAVAELRDIRAEQDGDAAVAFARELDRTALLAMTAALRSQGLFADPEDAHPTDEILQRAQVAPAHHRLVRRWLNALCEGGLMVREPDGRFRATPDGAGVTDRDVEAAWRAVDDAQPGGGLRMELIEYFRTATAHLPELLRGDLDPVQMLFPEGRLEIQESAYQLNFLSNSLNRLVVRAITDLATEHATEHAGTAGAEPLRLLEVGAGVGGTSIDLIPALAEHPVEYLFTDVSQFFLNQARERWGHLPWVKYGLFDLNLDHRPQGYGDNEFDVVLCANVLHYAKHAGRALERFRRMLRPGGWLVFIETTRDNYQILTSMEFLFDATAGDFEDVRAGRDQTFIGTDDWRRLLAEAGAAPALQLSVSDRALDAIGMHVFAVRFKPDRAPITAAGVRAEVQQRLPEQMVPAVVEVLDALPVTDNGKVDRRGLLDLRSVASAPARKQTAPAGRPQSPLEEALVRSWCQVLGLPDVDRGSDLFKLGGDSLVAAQLVGRIRETVPEAEAVPFDLMLREVLEGATVAALAVLIADATGSDGATGPDGSAGSTPGAEASGPAGPRLTPLQEGVGAVQIVVPDADGAADGATARLVPGRPALTLTWSPGDGDLDDPDAVADAVLRLLDDARPGDPLGPGPVRLVGQDAGALVAVAIARRLAETGVRIEPVTVVAATPAPLPVDGEGPAVELLYARRLGVAPEALGVTEAELAGVCEGGGGSCGAYADDPREWRLARIAAALDVDPGEIEAGYERFLTGWHWWGGHTVPAFAGDVDLVAGFDAARWPATAQALERTWREGCLGTVDVVFESPVAASSDAQGRR